MDSNPAEVGVKSKLERERGGRASSAAPRRVAATIGTRAVATQTGTPADAKEPQACADDVDLASLPDDAFALVLTAIDQPQAAARMLATCRRVRVAVPLVSASVGPSAPMVVQVQVTSTFLRSPEYHPPRNGGLELAAQHGWVELLAGLVEYGERWSDETRLQAVRHNHLQVVEWGRLHAPAFSWGATCSDAAGVGHLDLLKWARAQGALWTAPWGMSTCSAAALSGHLDLLKWTRAQGAPWTAPWGMSTCSAAALGGHLELLKWARAQSPPAAWDDRTCWSAAEGGHFALLQWARAQTPPAPWDASTCRFAAQGGHLELLR